MNTVSESVGVASGPVYKVAMVALTCSYYQVALYRELAANPRINLTVYFCSDEAIQGKDVRRMFNTQSDWGGEGDVLEGYTHKFLRNRSPFPSYLTPFVGLMNFGIWREIREQRPDLVIMMGWNNVTWWTATLACLKFKVPFFFMSDTNIQGVQGNGGPKSWIKKLILGKVYFKLARGFLCSGTANKRFYQHFGVPPAKLISFAYSGGYNYWLRRAAELASEKARIRTQLGLRQSTKVIQFIGRFVVEKDLPGLLRAYGLLRTPDTALVFVGDGNLNQELQDYVARNQMDSVHFFGFQNRNEVSKFYAMADVLVLPSARETWGMVVNEAMCFSLPIVISDQVGSGEDLVEHGSNGFTFPYREPGALTAALQRVLEMPDEERERMGQRSREIITEWSSSDHTAHLLEFMDSLDTAETQGPGVETPTVFSFIRYYLPGYKAGGPLRAMANLVEEMGDNFRFKVVTTDRDEGDTKPYSEITPNQWGQLGNAQVQYLTSDRISLRSLRRLFRNTPHDLVYLTGAFTPTFSVKILLLRRLGLLPHRPVIVAPRGEMSPAALRIKRMKKQIFLRAARAIGLYRNVTWHASVSAEMDDIRNAFGPSATIRVASDMVNTKVDGRDDSVSKPPKIPGTLKVVFLSRISQIKNLDGAIAMLDGLIGKVQLNIYGPIQDDSYWRQCQDRAQSLPSNITFSYCGTVPTEKVAEIFSQHDLFLFPTHSENFGHVIVESLAAGCPVLISDRTPWSEIEEERAGWVVDHENPARFQEILQLCLDMGPDEHAELSQHAQDYAIRFGQLDSARESNIALFKLNGQETTDG